METPIFGIFVPCSAYRQRKAQRFMKYKTMLFTLLACITLLASCAEETCPVTQSSKPEYYFKKKVKLKYVTKHNGKRKPTPSLIHITRVNYNPNSTR